MNQGEPRGDLMSLIAVGYSALATGNEKVTVGNPPSTTSTEPIPCRGCFRTATPEGAGGYCRDCLGVLQKAPWPWHLLVGPAVALFVLLLLLLVATHR